MGLPFLLQDSTVTFRFGDGVVDSIGKLSSRLAVSGGFFLMFDVDVVRADVSFLLWLDFRRNFK